MADLAFAERPARATLPARSTGVAVERTRVQSGSIGRLVLQRCGSRPCAGSCPSSSDEDLLLHRSAEGSGPVAHASEVAAYARPVLASAGRPLDPPTRQVMESYFERDLGHIRVHD